MINKQFLARESTRISVAVRIFLTLIAKTTPDGTIEPAASPR